MRKNKVTSLSEFLQNLPTLEWIKAGGSSMSNGIKGKPTQSLKQKNSKLRINFKSEND
ncbi:hypothetical protein LEP1GSC043_1728 [Leptospira weilii str. Ecochallenge]|uniref:Uncharacterized protein n=1 Tax=Leptospira weilii str. Ecochallenge TaxID=1049986 RepID=N1UG96_9LEPT|nr:hypothetical protein LEP1GSC043_1728 [Leptospira weilii str. Ecochallenge]